MELVRQKNESDLSYQKRINEATQERIQLIEKAARAEYYTNKKIEAEARLNEIYGKYGGQQAYENKNVAQQYKRFNELNQGFIGAVLPKPGILKDYEEIEQLKKIISDSSEQIKNNLVESVSSTKETVKTVSVEATKKETELQKAQADYARSLRALKARKDIEGMTTEEYNKALDELNRKMLIEARTSEDKELLNSDYVKMLQDAVNNPAFTESARIQEELNKVQKEYKKNADLAKAKLDSGLITQEEYNKSIREAAIAAAESAISIEGIGTAANEFIENMKNVTARSITAPTLEMRDKTFDYKKSETEKLQEDLSSWEKYVDELKTSVDEGATYLQDTLNNALSNVKSLKDALKIAEVEEDIKKMREELDKGIYDGIKNIANSSDRMVNAFTQMREVLNDSDASGWEKAMAVWNSMVNMADGILSVIDMVKNLTTLTDKLTLAQQVQQAMTVENAAIATSATLQQAAAEVAASQAKATAATVEMAAKSTAAYAYIPFAGVSLAAGQIEAMKALIASAALPFAKGGIVTGGPGQGDKILTRLNAGEMVLNQGQQANLFKMLDEGVNSKDISISVSGDAKVQGSSMFLAINNYMKQTGKRWVK